MKHDSMIRIGKLNKTFGLKGHLRFLIEPEFVKRIKKLETIFVLSKNKHFPYFIDEVDLSESGHGMIHFEDVKDKTAADLMVGKEIFVDEKTLKKKKKFESGGDFIGFKLIDEKSGEIGILEDFFEMPNHELGQFIYGEKEILFPWNEQVILKIDKKKKEILLKLPEGLMEVYL